jgi:hypothetical protein
VWLAVNRFLATIWHRRLLLPRKHPGKFMPSIRRHVLALVCAAIVLPVFLSGTLEAQTSAKLTLKATALGAAAKEKAILPVTAVAVIEITVRNDSSEAVSNVALAAKLNGVTLYQASSDWTPNGDDAKLDIAQIKPNEEITRRLYVLVAMAPLPPGKQASVAIEAKSGEFNVKTETSFAIADCASAFQAALTRVRLGPLDNVWAFADDYRKPNTALSRTRLFRTGTRNRDFANFERLAAGYQARLTADHDFFREGVRYTTARWSNELKAFAGQEPNPGICALNQSMIGGIRQTIAYVSTRLEPPQKAFARALDLLRKQTDAKDDDDLPKIALQAAEAAGAKLDNPPGTTFLILERTKEALKDQRPSAEQLENLSLVETVAWLEAQALRAKKLSDAIEGTITGISQAHKENCVCAF